MPSTGGSGGILIMFDKKVVEKLEECVVEFTGAYSIKNMEDSFQWAFARVYNPNFDLKRGLLWKELAGFFSWWELPSCCIGGDFNVTCFLSERSGVPRIYPMRDFSNFILEYELMDIPLI